MFGGPIFFVGLACSGNGQRLLGDVIRYGRTGGDVGTVSYGDGGDERTVTADKSIVSDRRLKFIHTVEIDGDRAAAEVASGSELGIADVGKMRSPGIFSEVRIFDLDKIADLYAAIDGCLGADVRIGPDVAVGGDLRAVDLRSIDHGAFADLGIIDHAPRSDDRF